MAWEITSQATTPIPVCKLPACDCPKYSLAQLLACKSMLPLGTSSSAAS